MKHIHLDERNTNSIDLEMSVPEQTLRDLICITEDSIKDLADEMDSMSKDIRSMRNIMQEQFPKIVEGLRDLIVCMDENTKKGMAKTDELIEAMKDE